MTLFVPSKQLRLSVLYSKLNTPKNAHLNIHYHFSVTVSLMIRRYFGELIPNSRTKLKSIKGNWYGIYPTYERHRNDCSCCFRQSKPVCSATDVIPVTVFLNRVDLKTPLFLRNWRQIRRLLSTWPLYPGTKKKKKIASVSANQHLVILPRMW